MKSIAELLLCRWRAAQLLLAYRDGDTTTAAALVAATAVEGLAFADMATEWELLAHQFAHRSRWYLAAEVDRAAEKLGVAR